jgi:phage FluMu protein Com
MTGLYPGFVLPAGFLKELQEQIVSSPPWVRGVFTLRVRASVKCPRCGRITELVGHYCRCDHVRCTHCHKRLISVANHKALRALLALSGMDDEAFFEARAKLLRR